MKKNLIVVCLFLSLISAKKEDVKSIFTAKEIVWYGLDFTKAKFVGGFNQVAGVGAATGDDIVNKWVPAWNSLVINEQKKYNLKKAFDKESVYYDIKTITNLNLKIDKEACFTPNAPEALKTEEISKMVEKYSGDKKEGIGLTFIIENFNKTESTATIDVVCFDIASKKVLLLEKFTSKPVGIGMRNFWAGSIFNTIKSISDGEYKSWKKKNK